MQSSGVSYLNISNSELYDAQGSITVNKTVREIMWITITPKQNVKQYIICSRFQVHNNLHNGDDLGKISRHAHKAYIYSYYEAAKINQWLGSPQKQTSIHFHQAREAFQRGTCEWLMNNTRFKDWKERADILLWIYGKGECLTVGHYCLLTSMLEPAGCGKTVLWYV